MSPVEPRPGSSKWSQPRPSTVGSRFCADSVLSRELFETLQLFGWSAALYEDLGVEVSAASENLDIYCVSYLLRCFELVFITAPL